MSEISSIENQEVKTLEDKYTDPIDTLSPDIKSAVRDFENRDLQIENALGNLLIAQWQVDTLRKRLVAFMQEREGQGKNPNSAIIFKVGSQSYAIDLKLLKDESNTITNIFSEPNMNAELTKKISQYERLNKDLEKKIAIYTKTKDEIEVPLRTQYEEQYRQYFKSYEEIKKYYEESVLTPTMKSLEEKKKNYVDSENSYYELSRQVNAEREEKVKIAVKQKENELDAKIKSYEKAVLGYKKKKAELRAEVVEEVKSEYEDKINNLEEQVKELENDKENHDCNETYGIHDECFTQDYIDENYVSNDTYSSMESERDDAREEQDRLSERIDDLISEKDELESDKNDIEQERDNMKEELDKLKEQIRGLGAEPIV